MPWPFDTTDSGTWDADAAQNGAPQAYAPQYAPQGGAWGMFSPGSLLSDPAFRRHAAYDALTNAGLSLIAASAPSPTPTNIGTMFGALAGGAAQGAQGSADRYMKLGTQAAQMRMLQAQAQAYPEAIKLMRSASGGGGYDPYGGAQPQQVGGAPATAPQSTPTPPAPDLQTAGQPQVDYLVKQGLSPVAASGVVGHLYQESKFNPAAKGDGGKSTGMAQWDPERYAGLVKFADEQKKSPTDPQTQLDYVMKELKSGDMGAQRAGALLQQAKTPEEATTAMMHFFRPKGYTPANPTAGDAYGNRLMYSSALAQGYPGNVAQGNGGPPMTGQPDQAPQATSAPVQLAQAGPQPGVPQQPPRPVALPRLPTNPPNPGKYMGLTMMGGPFAKSAEMLSKGEQAKFDAAMKIYNAQLAGTKEQREQAVSPINPDGSINQSVVAAAQAKTDAEKHYAESTAPYEDPEIQGFIKTLPKQTQAAVNSAIGRGDTKEAGELLDKATGGIPIELLKLRGPDLLEKLPPAEQSILSGLLDGSISIQDLPQRAAAAGSRMDLLALAKRVDPDFSTTNGPSRKAFEENLSHGQGLQMLSSLNIAPQHMLQYRKLMEANQNGNPQLLNEVHNYIAEHFGHPEITSAKAMQEFLATEVARAVHGAGALGESTVESALSKIGTQQSDSQNIGVLNEWAKALAARTNFLQYQAKYRHHIPDSVSSTYFTPDAHAAMDELAERAKAAVPPGGAPPPAAAGAPPAQLPQPKTPAEAMKLPSGTVFRNPEGKIKVRP